MSPTSPDSDRTLLADVQARDELSVPKSEGDRVERAAVPSLIDVVIESIPAVSLTPDGPLDRFLREKTVGSAIQQWLGTEVPTDREQLARCLNRDVAYIDRLIGDQIDAILHHPMFQRLEASWRGLHYLVRQADAEGDATIKVKVLHVTWKELERDFDRAVEFDQSQLFRKVYEQEFGTPGGEPYGALIADYEIHPRPSAEHPHDDIGILQSISKVAAAAFCPAITNVNPAMFGLDDFGAMQFSLSHAKTFEQLDYLKWRTFRESEDSRFVGLTLPRILMRLPHDDSGRRVDRSCYREDVTGEDFRKYLWGGAAFAFGGVLIRAFASSGWLADIRGVQRGVDGGGLVTDLPVQSFSTDKPEVAVKVSTDVVITDQLEKELSELGFIPLCDCYDTEYSAFYSNQSGQKPRIYDRAAASANARISAMLQYVLCVSRFAHYIKVLGREKIGSFNEPSEFERFLQNWIVRYVTSDSEAGPDVKARYPLREGKVQVRRHPGKAGSYQCILHLLPHYELDELSASVRLMTELTPERLA